jgi:Tfp pilus assembly protein PilN
MPFINLIEEQRLAQRRESAKARTALVVLASVAGLVMIGCGFFFVIGEALDGEISAMKAEADKVKPLLTEIESVHKQVAQMGPKLTTLKSARELTSKWDSILNHLTIQTPSGIYMTSVRCQAADPSKPIEVTFSGISTQLQTVGEFILRMQGCEQLNGVALKDTQERMLASATGIGFDVLADVEGSIEEVKVKDESKEASK